MRKLFIAGCGYCGERVAARAIALGWSVTAQVRDEQRGMRLQEAGCTVIRCTMDRLDEIPPFPLDGQLLLYSVPPQGGAALICVPATSAQNGTGPAASATDRLP